MLPINVPIFSGANTSLLAGENVSRTGGGDAEFHPGLPGEALSEQKNHSRIKKRKLCDGQGGFLTTEERCAPSRLCSYFQIVQSDGFMNITLEDVLFTDALGSKTKFDSFFVQNRLIR